MVQFFKIIWFGAVLKLGKGEMNSQKSRGTELDPGQRREERLVQIKHGEGESPAGAG